VNTVTVKTVLCLRPYGIFCPYRPRVLSDFCVKFGVRNLHTVLLDIRAFRDIWRTEGRALVLRTNEITETA
jgi:hypothetical protein